jgi:CO/xanthine dehydrogenase Mo-binding subunit
MGSNGSRSMVVGGSAVTLASGKVIDKGKRLAIHLLEAAEADIEFANGKFTVVSTDRDVSLTQVARASFQPARLPRGMKRDFTSTPTSRLRAPLSRTAVTSARWSSTPRPARSALLDMSSSTMSAR